MPTIITRGAASAQAFGFSSSTVSLAGPYWITKLSSADYTLVGSTQGITKDSSGNYYLPYQWTAKFSSTGIADSTLKFSYGTGTPGLSAYQGMAFDNGSVMYAAAGFDAVSNNVFEILKQDSSGNAEFAKSIGLASSAQSVSRNMTKTLDNQFAGIYHSFQGTTSSYFYSYASDGTLNYSTLGTAINSNFAFVFNAATNSNGQIIVDCGNGLYALSSSGSFSWANQVNFGNYSISNVCCDNLANVYHVLYDSNSTTCFVAKFNSGGSLVASASFPITGSTLGVACSCDSSGNLYIGSGAYFTKFNSSLSPIYTRRLLSSNGAANILSLDNYTSGLAMSATMAKAGSPPSDCFVFNLPQDGSLTATYTVGSSTIYYITSSNPTMTSVSPTITARTWSMNSYTPTQASVSVGNSPLTITRNTIALV
jgi:hypothetical protein